MSRAKLTSSQGTVEFGVVSEERPDYVADITEYPIEGGNQISDHAALRPATLAIDGVVAGPSAAGVLATVRSWQENRLLVTYSGRGTYRDFVIKEFRPTEDVEVGDGFRFSMTLQEGANRLPGNNPPGETRSRSPGDRHRPADRSAGAASRREGAGATAGSTNGAPGRVDRVDRCAQEHLRRGPKMV